MSGSGSMMNVEPQAIVFRNVVLNQTYTTSMCISNPLTVSVEFTLRASNPRYTLTPNKVNLGGGQSVVVTVRLLVAHYPNMSMGYKGVEEFIHLKSRYFEQNVSTTFFLDTGSKSALEGRPPIADRSSSPSMHMRDMNAPGSGAPGAMLDSFAEVQSQLQAKNEKIAYLEGVIAKLQAPYPDMQNIINGRVEREREDFEKKSEKALKILQAKDEIIASLRAKLAAQEVVVSSMQPIKPTLETAYTLSSPGSGAGSSKLDNSLFIKAAAQKERIQSLEAALQEARSIFRDEQHTHGVVKSALVEEQGKLKRLEHSSAEEVSALKKEVSHFKERLADQAEQIKVLVHEVSKVRTERDHDVSDMQKKAQRDISTIQAELARCQKANKDLEYQNSVLQRTIDSKDTLLEGEASTTSKLQQENKRLSERAQLLLKDKELMDQQRMERGYLMQQLDETRAMEKDLRFRLQEAHELVRTNEEDTVAARKEALDAKLASDALKTALEDQQVRLTSAQEKNAVVSDRDKMVDAHSWWAYIWHELSKNKKNTDLILKHNRNKLVPSILMPATGSSAPFYAPLGGRGDPRDKENKSANLLIEDGAGARSFNSFYPQNYGIAQEGEQAGQVLIYVDDSADPMPVDEVLILVSSLKELVRTQAVEVAKLRQDHLKVNLNFKKVLEAKSEDLKKANLEIIQLSALNRRQGAEKEAKLSEMASTIRELSHKSDIHLQFAHVRTDLQAERMLNFSLKADVDSYRGLHDQEREVSTALRAELASLKSTQDSVAVLKTILDVPGVDPASLLECMCDKVVNSEDELAKTRTALALAHSQIESLQRIKGVKQEARGVASNAKTVSMSNIINKPQRVGAAGSDAKHVDVSVAELSAEDVLNNEGAFEGAWVDNMTEVGSGHFNILIDGDATPQKLLECLDSVHLAQHIKIKEDHISELQLLNANLSASLVAAEQRNNGRKELLHVDGDADSFEKHYRFELDSSLRQLKLSEVALEEARNEAKRLRDQVSTLRKAQVILQAQISTASLITAFDPFDTKSDDGKDSTSASLDVEESRQEVKRLQAMLDERTSQLRTVSESLELLEERESSSSIAREKGLVSRVVALTAEFSALTELLGREKRVNSQHEHAQRQRQRDANRLRLRIKQSEESHATLHLQLANLNERLKDAEHGRIDDREKHSAEMQKSLAALKEAETEATRASIQVDELKKQAQLFEDDSIEGWLQVILAGQEETDAASPFITGIHHLHETDRDGVSGNANTDSTTGADSDEVMRTVKSLLDEWRNANAPGSGLSMPYNNTNFGGAASQSHGPAALARLNQQFMQRVSDMVLQASRCAKRATEARYLADNRRAAASVTARVSTDRLRSCLLYLNRCRRRIFALERLVGVDLRAHAVQHDKRVSLLQGVLEEERNAHAIARNVLVDTRRTARMAELRRKFENRRVAALQARVGELEGRGTAVLRGKQEAVAVFEERLVDAEENLQRWFSTQLPVLLSGMNIETSSEEGKSDTFALTESLCAEKSKNTKLQLEAQVATEKLLLQRELLAEQEGVLHKWRSETEAILGTHTAPEVVSDLDTAGNAASTIVADGHGSLLVVGLADQQLDAVLHTAAEIESQLTERVAKLTADLQSAAEENLDAKSRAERAVSQEEELKLLVEHVMGEERSFKTAAAKQLAHLQVSYERTSSVEFRKMKRLYDDDKEALRKELERVLSMVDFARVAMLEQAKRYDQDTETALAAWATAEAEAKAVVLKAGEAKTDASTDNASVSEEASARVRANLTSAAQAAFTRAMDVKKDILSQQNGAKLLATILESPGKLLPSGDTGRLALSTEGNRIVDDSGKPLVFPDLSEVVSGRIRSLLNKLANGPDLESKMKAMRVYTGAKDPDFTVGGFGEKEDESSVSSYSDDGGAAKKLEQDIAALQHSLEEERLKSDQTRREYLALEKYNAVLEKSVHERHAQPVYRAPPSHEGHAPAPAPGPAPAPVPAPHHTPHYLQPTVATIRQGAHVDERDPHLRDIASHEVHHDQYSDSHNPHLHAEQQHPSHASFASHSSGPLSHVPGEAYHSASFLAAHPHGHTPGIHGHSAAQHGGGSYTTYDANGRPVHHHGHPPPNPHFHSAEHNETMNRMTVEHAKREAEHQKAAAVREAQRAKEELEAQLKAEAHEKVLELMRSRLQEVEDAANKELDDARLKWESEKHQLHEVHSEHREGTSAALEELRSMNEAQTNSLREKYEEALRQTQEAMEQQGAASEEQIIRLENSLNRTQRSLEQESAAATQGNQARMQLEAQLADMQRDMEEALAGILGLREQCNQYEARISDLQLALQTAENALVATEGKLADAQSAVADEEQLLKPPTVTVGALNPLGPDSAMSPARRSKQVSEEFAGIQMLLERTTDDLDDARAALRESEKRYAKDVGLLKEQCQALAKERNSLQSASAASASKEFRHGSLEAEEAVRRLEYRYKCKVVELETVLKGLGDEYAPAEEEQLTPMVPLAMQSELLRIRLVAAEQEIETLQQLLSRQRAERRDLKKGLEALREEYAEAQVSVETLTAEAEANQNARGRPGSKGILSRSRERERSSSTGTGARSDAMSSPGRVRLLTPTRSSAARQAIASPLRSNFGEARELPRPTSRSPSLMRRNRKAAAEAAGTGAERSSSVMGSEGEPTSLLLAAEREALKTARAEINRLTVLLDETSKQTRELKEDVRRKAKLLTAKNAAKAGEEAAAELWKNESQALEENVRRLTRAVNTKDNLIKDMRSKLEEQLRREAELNESKDTHVAPSAALSGDLLGLSHSELRSKLRVSEQERLKIRSQRSHMHDRLVETQAEVQKLRDLLEAANKAEDRVETLRNQLARREAQVRSLKLQIQSVKDASDAAIAEIERNAADEKAQHEAMRSAYHEMVRREADRVNPSTRGGGGGKQPTKAATGKAAEVPKAKPVAAPIKPAAAATVTFKAAVRATSEEETDQIGSESDNTSDDEAIDTSSLPVTLGAGINEDLADILAQLSGKL